MASDKLALTARVLAITSTTERGTECAFGILLRSLQNIGDDESLFDELIQWLNRVLRVDVVFIREKIFFGFLRILSSLQELRVDELLFME